MGYFRHSGKTLRQPRTLGIINAVVNDVVEQDEDDVAEESEIIDADLEEDENIDTYLVVCDNVE